MTATGRCGERWLPLPCWIALAKQQLHKSGDVGIHGRDSLSKTLFIVAHVIPLTGRKLVFRIQLAIDQGQQRVQPTFSRVVGHTQIGDGMTTVGMMTGEVPHDRAPPVMTDPDGLLSAHGVQ